MDAQGRSRILLSDFTKAEQFKRPGGSTKCELNYSTSWINEKATELPLVYQFLQVQSKFKNKWFKNKKMSSEQPLKKKVRRGNELQSSDETDYIPSDLSSLNLLHVNENHIALNTANVQFHGEKHLYQINSSSEDENKIDGKNILPEIINQFVSSGNVTIEPASNITQKIKKTCLPFNITNTNYSLENDLTVEEISLHSHNIIKGSLCNNLTLSFFQSQINNQCLCGVPEIIINKPLELCNDYNSESKTMLSEWPTKCILQLLSNMQQIFNVYLKQNNKGLICSKIVAYCDTLLQNEYNIIEQIISLCDTRDKYVNFLSARVLSSLLIIAKTNTNNEWLEIIFNYLTVENIDYDKIIFALEVMKRVVEWKDIESHVLEESDFKHFPGSSSNHNNIDCQMVPFTDAESYDTSTIKGLIIKSLETKWPELINKMLLLINNNSSVAAQTCVLTFLGLWESTISVKANLSIVETKPFYAHLESFVQILCYNLPSVIWKQLLSLFNEVLCYGSTLALQDMLPDDTCQLAHLIVRYVKDDGLLYKLPYKREEGYTVNGFVGIINCNQPEQSNVDRTLLQKMVLLVLKSVAVMIKESRSDSSDSSIGSDDNDFYQDMQLIERSIRDVLKKLNIFIKNSLEYHPEASFSKVLIHLFSDQDDYMIESMVCTLDIITGISYGRNAIFPDLIIMLNPIYSFIEFLKIVNNDYHVLLDYLISNETCFLLYLLRFLKYTKKNWPNFLSSCRDNADSQGNELDNTMTVLIRLKIQISRLVSQNLFPYNINPVLKLLEICESFAPPQSSAITRDRRHLVLSTFAQFHQQTSAFVCERLLSPAYVCFHPQTSAFTRERLISSANVCFHTVSPANVSFHLRTPASLCLRTQSSAITRDRRLIVLSTFAWFHPQTSAFVYFHLRTSVFTRKRMLLPVFTRKRLVLPANACFYPRTPDFIRERLLSYFFTRKRLLSPANARLYLSFARIVQPRNHPRSPAFSLIYFRPVSSANVGFRLRTPAFTCVRLFLPTNVCFCSFSTVNVCFRPILSACISFVCFLSVSYTFIIERLLEKNL
ncbi:unnamed protein product [Brassicogethes aeneus]|uniref:Protein lines n=1 Tax=Brassicogethes aeneus TaxID=1431903 RepID=A0A9P0ATL8_BRAAE|nr:unnamed protein product [Brassicogethes aeneus]